MTVSVVLPLQLNKTISIVSSFMILRHFCHRDVEKFDGTVPSLLAIGTKYSKLQLHTDGVRSGLSNLVKR